MESLNDALIEAVKAAGNKIESSRLYAPLMRQAGLTT